MVSEGQKWHQHLEQRQLQIDGAYRSLPFHVVLLLGRIAIRLAQGTRNCVRDDREPGGAHKSRCDGCHRHCNTSHIGQRLRIVTPSGIVLHHLCWDRADSHAANTQDHVSPNEKHHDSECKSKICQGELVGLFAPHEAKSRKHVIHSSTQRAAPPALHGNLLHESSWVRRLAQGVQKVLHHRPYGYARKDGDEQLKRDRHSRHPQAGEGHSRRPYWKRTNGLYQLDIERRDRMPLSI
mmetsp:Transcript_9553/g.17735  ORF Transcript_9553/g.17735 Transcript_9553/m.17735 type:complete len:237 (-) Transcript_9553:238-948(-)